MLWWCAVPPFREARTQRYIRKLEDVSVALHLSWDTTIPSFLLGMLAENTSASHYIASFLLTSLLSSCTSVSEWLMLSFLDDSARIAVWGPILLNHTQTDIQEIAPAMQIVQTSLIQTAVNK